MKLTETFLPGTNVIATDYIERKKSISAFFDYTYQKIESYEERYQELMGRDFERAKVADHLDAFNRVYNPDEKTLKNIERLKREDAVTVVGGQQAGVMTGPLYTIYKAISVIKLAEEKEKELGVPVIPVFWIAGEDHDFHEINHVYTFSEKENKVAVPQKQYRKQALSDIELDQTKMKEWTDEILHEFGETSYTSDIREWLESISDHSVTFVDHFCHIVTKLFSKYGLVLVDSGNEAFRAQQTKMFKNIINDNEALNQRVLEQAASLHELEYPVEVDLEENQANLFVKVKGERVLLERNGTMFKGKAGEVEYSKEELLQIAEEEPGKLSNNVVTRPIMQDAMFPVLAFVGGPGELSYWALLKPAFRTFDFKLPVIVPRMTFTFVERHIQKDASELSLNIEDVVKQGVSEDRKRYVQNLDHYGLEEAFSSASEKIESIHEDLRELTSKIDKGLESYSNKNGEFIQRQLELLQKRLQNTIIERHEHTLRKFSEIGLALKPNGAPQERKWNIVYYLNWHGPDFIDRIMKLDLSINENHKVVYL
ncbi:bacillithiol biosynthesis cysteine-adding enzyme BshC [Guptibacillus algicola]|uniref:bacillithiol biosynthesis cysteine-adding enzyme BshC n=1 Tax=Guptibacillus algicola TaxID=225844 RepID=UPI001CD40116|nr:bacillithiol biosynthesis cysteine-adding enzyme BshC [Alkalihalobacillus algicola]MCA0987972.1 bacillithiol biosynthesis cysteine-adding enzyme BshC [Alkalihalobacillus algicola]